jgi:hypothetical protein
MRGEVFINGESEELANRRQTPIMGRLATTLRKAFWSGA